MAQMKMITSYSIRTSAKLKQLMNLMLGNIQGLSALLLGTMTLLEFGEVKESGGSHHVVNVNRK
jgi:hypothetical protein